MFCELSKKLYKNPELRKRDCKEDEVGPKKSVSIDDMSFIGNKIGTVKMLKENEAHKIASMLSSFSNRISIFNMTKSYLKNLSEQFDQIW